jgi:hypothetical protein
MEGSSDAPMRTYPELGALLEAARNCSLPPSRTQPEPGTPNYPTSMLAVSMTLPPRMQRSSWCLADYTIIEKLYKGDLAVNKGLKIILTLLIKHANPEEVCCTC